MFRADPPIRINQFGNGTRVSRTAESGRMGDVLPISATVSDWDRLASPNPPPHQWLARVLDLRDSVGHWNVTDRDRTIVRKVPIGVHLLRQWLLWLIEISPESKNVLFFSGVWNGYRRQLTYLSTLKTPSRRRRTQESLAHSKWFEFKLPSRGWSFPTWVPSNAPENMQTLNFIVSTRTASP